MISKSKIKTDVCLILEGTYPYIYGGVSSWAHELIKNHPQLTFSLASIVPPDQQLQVKYEVPDNVLEIKTIYLHRLQKEKISFNFKRKKEHLKNISSLLNAIFNDRNLDAFGKLVEYFNCNHDEIGRRLLIDSKLVWDVIELMYNNCMKNSSFLDYFWSWRSLFGGLFTILLSELPDAECYHSLCTGYAGLMLARASFETNKPCLVTEHGIYTNERRIEIATAEWLYDQTEFSLSIKSINSNTGLHGMWTDTFAIYSEFCYKISEYIITLYEGNRELQIYDGAPIVKTKVIPNGIDYERFSIIKRIPHTQPTIALIGRVVPIKDIKTYIKAVMHVRRAVPSVNALIMGPTDEDSEYYNECVSLINDSGLQKSITFTGRVKIDDYLGKIDLIVLTSLSEAQPLVILECGAAGIPTVATNVGSCNELINGKEEENPQLGPGGAVTSLSNPKATAAQIVKLLTDYTYYDKCSAAIKSRVFQYYKIEDQHNAYTEIYSNLLNRKDL